MKKLITAADVKKYAEEQKTNMSIGIKTIITPAARDAANEYGIKFVVTEETQQLHENNNYSGKQIETLIQNIDTTQLSGNISSALIEKIVAEVMMSLSKCKSQPEMVKKVDPSGLRLVKGNTVYLENFNTGNPQDKVRIKELFNLKESPNMSTGLMEIEKSSFDYDLKGDEICYIINGTLKCTVNGNSYLGQAGDVLYIPANSQVRYSTEEKTKYFYVNYPAGSKG